MRRGERPRLVLVPDPVGETVVLGAEGGTPPLRNASPRSVVPSVDAAPDELADAAEALAALLRGLAPAESTHRARPGDEDPSR